MAPAYPQGTEPESGVLRVPARRVPFDPEDGIMSWRAPRNCLATVHDESCDLVHVQTPFLAHYAGLKAARARGVPVVATCHTYFEDYLHHYVPLLPACAGASLARSLMKHQLRWRRRVRWSPPPALARARCSPSIAAPAW